MKSQDLSKVFQEFDQADTSISRKFGGTGLGLSIVQRLVKLMNGNLEAESELGKGTLMRIRIPMETTRMPDSIVSETSSETIDLTGLRILLVDDDRVGLRYLEMVLNYFGAEVLSYPGGVAFRDEFQAADYDLALIDIQMPEFSGFEVVKKLKSIDQFQELPVMAMTANVFIEEKERLLEVGFEDFILKPFQEKSLVSKLGKFFPDRVSRTENKVIPNEEDFSYLFQLSDLEKFCMGDQDLLQDILKDLIRETELDLQKLKRARLNDRWDVVLEICHQLGSRLGQIKSPAGPLARKIENGLKINSKTGIQENLNALDQKIKETLQALKEKISQTV
jgi:CheY-like chemotaxis protein